LRGLNAGLARGTLQVFRPGKTPQKFDRDGIYVLPATTEDLPPVAGIITTGEGNILSHVQLLARNLGIPNVAIDSKWLAHIQSMEGQRVVMAVSPRGIVQLTADGPQWNRIFKKDTASHNILIRPDMKKLDLNTRSFIALDKLRANRFRKGLRTQGRQPGRTQTLLSRGGHRRPGDSVRHVSGIAGPAHRAGWAQRVSLDTGSV
jgi:phosphohistidine swiveling domain-containing protein